MNSLRYVGLDVHKESIAVAVAEEGRAAPTSMGTMPNDPAAVRKLIRQLGGRARLRCCYEAGPCGYVLYHQLTDQGVSCQVVAPSLVPRRPGDRVKTDRRDALKLALGFRAGTLTPIWVPDPADEALRDLVRAREDGLEDLLRARHRLSKLLLRAGVRPPRDLRSWSAKHRQWLAQLTCPAPAQQLAFEHYRLTIDQTLEQLASVDRHLLEVVGESRFAEVIAAFQALHGVGFVTALTVATEIQNFSRFATAPSFMGFNGVCPSEYSSGSSQFRGAITRAGNPHVRRVVVEAAWHFRRRPKDTARRRRELAELPPWLQAIARRADERLSRRFARLSARRKLPQKVVVAVARELLGFMWAIGCEVERRQTAVAA
jgi:transposase